MTTQNQYTVSMGLSILRDARHCHEIFNEKVLAAVQMKAGRNTGVAEDSRGDI
jgi:hypothetical protein